VDDEYKRLSQQSGTGAFEPSDDMDAEANAFFSPMTSEEIALRAVLLELNSLVEWELAGLVSSHVTNRAQSMKLIEHKYGITLSNMPGFDKVEQVRASSNAWKHRKGFKMPGWDCGREEAISKWSLEREKVRSCIIGVRQFLSVTLKACNTTNVKINAASMSLPTL